MEATRKIVQVYKRGARVLAIGKAGRVTRRWEYKGGMCGHVHVRLDGENVTRYYHWHDVVPDDTPSLVEEEPLTR